LSQQKLQEH